MVDCGNYGYKAENGYFVIFKWENGWMNTGITFSCDEYSEISIKSFLRDMQRPQHYSLAKGCPHCLPQNKPFNNPTAHEFRVIDSTLFFFDSERGWEGELIQFCPWCGRKL